ncbi:MAG: hypothetical protein Q8O42_18405 [Acidobacteriota bacterium]|nr:hypothetical protein [Acidobacteriota bacterium]
MVKKRAPVKKPKRPKRPPGSPPRPDTPKIPRKRPKPLKKRPRKPPPDELTPYLAANPRIANAIGWWGQGSPGFALQAYPSWTIAQKDELAGMYAFLRRRRFPRLGLGRRRPVLTPLSATPTPSAFDSTNTGLGTIFDHTTAWRYFLAYVAHSLLVDIFQLVPWSLDDLSPIQLREVLSNVGLFEHRRPENDYRLEYGATPGDPLNLSQFLFTNALVGADRRETIGRLLQWSVRMRHFFGGFNPATALNHWQYNGWPPAERVISGTTHSQYGFGHWSGGCGAMVSFLKIVLRTVNIPVEAVGAGGHSMPHFMVENLYLSHGDDPYGTMMKSATPPIPGDELFIDQGKFDAWFGQAISQTQRERNVARRVAELAVQYLPTALLGLRCTDLAQGVINDAASAVYTQVLPLSRYYTVAELQALNLWGRLDTKIAALGGCANIP